jgi:hypothetical protein
MDRLKEYRRLIQCALRESPYNVHGSSYPDVDTICIFDEASDNYLLLDIGWTEQGRVRRTILHVRIKNDKIWIEEDWTEEGIANELLRAGVPKEDIVLAFQPPSLRPLTEFATV